jgi:hypothetical protein
MCYSIFPTQACQQGQFIVDKSYLILPAHLLTAKYLLKLGFFDYGRGNLIPANTQDPLGRIEIRINP